MGKPHELTCRSRTGETCKQARACADAGTPAKTIAVNVSGVQFQNENFLDGLFAALKKNGLEPAVLELDVNENVLMRHLDRSALVLKTLRDEGVQIAVDNFGTGNRFAPVLLCRWEAASSLGRRAHWGSGCLANHLSQSAPSNGISDKQFMGAAQLEPIDVFIKQKRGLFHRRSLQPYSWDGGFLLLGHSLSAH
jgi:hypothetical protein